MASLYRQYTKKANKAQNEKQLKLLIEQFQKSMEEKAKEQAEKPEIKETPTEISA